MRKSKCFVSAVVGCTSIFENAWKWAGGSSQNASSIRITLAAGFFVGSVVMEFPSRQPARAEARLGVRQGRQRPGADTGRLDVAVHVDVEHEGLSGPDRVLERGF